MNLSDQSNLKEGLVGSLQRKWEKIGGGYVVAHLDLLPLFSSYTQGQVFYTASGYSQIICFRITEWSPISAWSRTEGLMDLSLSHLVTFVPFI